MKLTPEMLLARVKAGYISPDQQPCICQKCSAIRDRNPLEWKPGARYYCRRHHFYVNALGYCPDFGTGTFAESEKPKPPQFKQQYLL